MGKNYIRQSNRGLTLIELMTVLFIIIMLAMVGFPTYQEYQNRANLAEAETTIGTMEKHLRTYYLDHGSFYSADPNPSTVPGLASLGSSSTFTSSGGWTTIGPPMPDGSTVTFSYQVFAGQTPAGSTTPVTTGGFHNPTDDMNLIRRTSTSYNEYHFPQATRVAFNETPLKLDWSDFNFCARAADPTDAQRLLCDQRCQYMGEQMAACQNSCLSGEEASLSCVNACTALTGNADGCNRECSQPTNGACDGIGDPDCYPNDPNNGQTAAQNCVAGCTAVGHSVDDCNYNCGQTGDGSCRDGDVADIDCYHDTTSNTGPSAQDNCNSACVAVNNDVEGCNARCAKSDSTCGDVANPYGDPDCYNNTSNVGSCISDCEAQGASAADCGTKCSEPGDGTCGHEGHYDIDCFPSSGSSNAFADCVSACGGGPDCGVQCLQTVNSSCYDSCAGDETCKQSCNKDYCHNKCSLTDDPAKCKANSCDGSSPVVDCSVGDKASMPECTNGVCDPGVSNDPDCGGGGDPGAGGGGNAGGGSSGGSGDSGGYYSGSGDAGGGTSGGGGSTSSGSGGTVTTSSSECASFGIRTATDFGIQQNVPGYNWVVMTAVGNFSPGTTCTLAAKVLQVVNGQVSQSGDLIKVNLGE